MSKIRRIPVLLALLALLTAPAYAGSLTITWDRNPEPDVVGYRVLYGTQSGVYTFNQPVGNVTTWTADNLTEGRIYYFAVQAVNADGLISPPSLEVPGVVALGTTACTGVTVTAPATGVVGSPVAFTVQPSPAGCTGTVTYQWALGDGTSSTLGTVSHAYSAARSYTWTLAAMVNGAAVASRTGTIAVSNGPCTGVTATAPATGVMGSPVAFTAQPSPAGCTGTVTYQWALGDGTSSTLGSVSHAYSAARSYTWTLAARVNGVAVASRTGTIAVANGPCTSVTATAPATGAVGSPLAFTAQPGPAGCTGTVTYQWALGDGTSSTLGTVSHAYSAARSYTWTLAARVNGVAVAPQTGTITVSNYACTPRTVMAAPAARPGVHPSAAMWQDMGMTVQAGDDVLITAAGTWRTGSQVLTAAGDGSQVVTGSNCSLSGAPLLALVARIGETGTPFLVQSGQAIPVTTTGTLYLAPNDDWYLLWDNAGSLAVSICVRAPEPVACTGVTATAPAAGAVGSPAAFTAHPSPAGCIGAVTYEWAFGDGTSSPERTASHTYYAAQSYTWTLSATVDNAAVAPQTGTIAVSNYACTPRTVVAAPAARPGVHPSLAMWQDMGMTVQAGDDLRITAAGTWRNGDRMLTAAGDGSEVATGSNCSLSGAPLLALVARIGETGTPFLVQSGQAIPVATTGTLYLAPNDNWYQLWDNAGSLAVTICVRAPEPVACTGVTAMAPATGAMGSPVAFTAQPSPAGCVGAVTYEWAFGDGTSSPDGTASHTYYAVQSYTWTLSATVDGAAVAPRTGTIAVSDYACTPRTVMAAPAARAGVHPAVAMWQDMGMTVQAGDDLRITAAGTWRTGSQALTAAGDGSRVVTGSDCSLSGAPLLALVARIGETGTPFLVQSGQEIPVTKTGTLYLAPNDNWYLLWDNAGSLTVTVCSRR